ncbi:MAG: TonB-dependent receptor [Bacteroidia bacterium]|nr:TonB-dependent receptor [Bacteroidia bacterium]
MKRLLLLLFILYSTISFAQNASVKGTVTDTVNLRYMGYSGVSLILFRDSILIQHMFTSDKGKFEFTDIVPDTYRLQITHPGFADYEEKMVLQPGETKQLDTINMLLKENLLREIIFKDKRDAIRIKGDTTEFLVDSFLVNKNSNVEDLLKRLPGIQVDKTGKITAQGQEVKKVLVDGEEFFGNDHTVATRNIKAENIETVQVFDQKSEQTQQTGIDDGTKEKTINLTLKDDAKKGYFGKANAGAGTQDRYEHDAMFNSFKKKRKFSFYGATANTNKTSLSWEDADMYAGGKGNTEFDEASGYMYTYYNGEDDDYSGTGIPQTWYGGTHYSNKSPDEKKYVVLNGTHKELRVNGYDNDYSKYILPDTLYFNNQRKNFSAFKESSAAKGSFEYKRDSLTTFKFKINGSSGSSSSTNRYISENLNGEYFLVNNNDRTQTENGTKDQLSFSVSMNKKFKTKGRSLYLAYNQNYRNSTSKGFLLSQTNYFKSDSSLLQTDLIDQRKNSDNKTNTWEGKVIYTEPLVQNWFVITDYSIRNTISSSRRYSFTKNSLNNEYDQVVDSLSNSLRYNIMGHQGGIALRYTTKKMNLSFGVKASFTDLYQRNLVNDSIREQHFLNLFPSVSFNYKWRNTSNLSISLSGYTDQPTLQQLQPLKDNSNPLQIMVGNPNLKQSFSTNLNVWYNSYKPISGRSLYMGLNASTTKNDFSYADNVDSSGRRTNQTINVNGNYYTYFYSNYYVQIKKIHTNIGNSLNGSASRNSNMVNGLKNTNNNVSAGYGLELEYNLDEKFDFSLNGNWDFNYSRSSLRGDMVTQFWIQTYSADLYIELPFKMEFEAECSFNIRQKTAGFNRNLNTTIINSNLSKRFLKNDNLTLTLNVHDLLNQNIGFERTANSNFINENTHTVLKRYLLLSLTWNFTHNGAQKKK